jgi:hypothetical protein
MAQRRQIRVSRSLEGEGERPATGYGEPEAGAATSGIPAWGLSSTTGFHRKNAFLGVGLGLGGGAVR